MTEQTLAERRLNVARCAVLIKSAQYEQSGRPDIAHAFVSLLRSLSDADLDGMFHLMDVAGSSGPVLDPIPQIPWDVHDAMPAPEWLLLRAVEQWVTHQTDASADSLRHAWEVWCGRA
jgi:hypothetical protein